MDYNIAFQKLTEAKSELGDKELGACSVLLDAVVDWTSWRALTLCTTPTSIKEYFLNKLRSTDGQGGTSTAGISSSGVQALTLAAESIKVAAESTKAAAERTEAAVERMEAGAWLLHSNVMKKKDSIALSSILMPQFQSLLIGVGLEFKTGPRLTSSGEVAAFTTHTWLSADEVAETPRLATSLGKALQAHGVSIETDEAEGIWALRCTPSSRTNMSYNVDGSKMRGSIDVMLTESDAPNPFWRPKAKVFVDMKTSGGMGKESAPLQCAAQLIGGAILAESAPMAVMTDVVNQLLIAMLGNDKVLIWSYGVPNLTHNLSSMAEGMEFIARFVNGTEGSVEMEATAARLRRQFNTAGPVGESVILDQLELMSGLADPTERVEGIMDVLRGWSCCAALPASSSLDQESDEEK